MSEEFVGFGELPEKQQAVTSPIQPVVSAALPKTLIVKEKDLCVYNDYLVGSAADIFVSEGYTHINIDGCIIQCEYVGQHDDGAPLILLGEG